MTQPMVDVGKFIASVGQHVNGHVVGYAGVIGSAAGVHVIHGGYARTSANGIAVPYTTSTPAGIASTSKLLTALAAVTQLDGAILGTIDGTPIPGPVHLDTPMWSYLPQGWHVQDAGVKEITFRELLTHTSGLPEYNPLPHGGLDYATLQQFICGTSVLPTAPNPAPFGSTGPRYPVVYSNVGFALFRLLLPAVHALNAPNDPWRDNPNAPVAQRAQAFADQYEKIVLATVFGKAGVTTGPTTGTPPGSTYAFGYAFPGTAPGKDQNPENLSLDAGPGAWFVSIDQLTPVLQNLSNLTGKILTAEQWNHLQGIDVPAGYLNIGKGFGIDGLVDGGTGYRWVEKNGGYESQEASIAFFGSETPGTGQGPLFAALFLNSDVSGPGWVTGWYQCTKCDTLYSPSGGGVCPATGTAKQPHTDWGQYILSTDPVPDGQGDWRRCSKCGAACYQSSPTDASVCPRDYGRHDPTGPTFNVSQTGQGNVIDQTDWRWCRNCGVLAYSFGGTSAGVCAQTLDTGPHEFALDDANYVLPSPYGPDIILLQAFRDSIQ